MYDEPIDPNKFNSKSNNFWIYIFLIALAVLVPLFGVIVPPFYPTMWLAPILAVIIGCFIYFYGKNR